MRLTERRSEAIEALALPVLAMAGALLLFGAFVAAGGKSPLQAWALLFKGAFGDWFSWQNTLTRAAPLMLTALAVAIPARAGLIVIGGEGAFALGALGAAALPLVVPVAWLAIAGVRVLPRPAAVVVVAVRVAVATTGTSTRLAHSAATARR
jgi:simple sugar transport system permease protein